MRPFRNLHRTLRWLLNPAASEGAYSGASPATLLLGLTAGLTGAFILGWIAGDGIDGRAAFRTWFAVGGFLTLLLVNAAGVQAFARQQRFVLVRSTRIVRDQDRLRKDLDSSVAELADTRAALERERQRADLGHTIGDQFLMHMNHELRTPLNAIIGFASLMRDQVLGPLGRERYVSYAAEIHDSGLGLLRLIENILDLADIRSGRRSIDPTPNDPDVLAQTAIESVGAETSRKKILVAATVPPDCPRLFADPAMIRRMLASLVANAVAFSPKGGRIDLRFARADDNGVAVEVTDAGPGISADEARLAMDFPAPPDPMRRRQGRGPGLGLPLVRAMMELHKGSAEIQSRPGKGTTVRLIFPPPTAPAALTPPRAR